MERKFFVGLSKEAAIDATVPISDILQEVIELKAAHAHTEEIIEELKNRLRLEVAKSCEAVAVVEKVKLLKSEIQYNCGGVVSKELFLDIVNRLLDQNHIQKFGVWKARRNCPCMVCRGYGKRKFNEAFKRLDSFLDKKPAAMPQRNNRRLSHGTIVPRGAIDALQNKFRKL